MPDGSLRRKENTQIGINQICTAVDAQSLIHVGLQANVTIELNQSVKRLRFDFFL